MYSTLPDKKIPTSSLKFLFDSGIRKAVEEIMPERLTHWPADYETAFRAAQDRHGRLLIIEVKRGKLPRGAVDQLLDYFGMMKQHTWLERILTSCVSV